MNEPDGKASLRRVRREKRRAVEQGRDKASEQALMARRIAALMERGQAAIQAGQRERAERCFMAVLELDPDNEQALLYRAGLARDAQQSVALLERALAINPHNELAQEGLQWAQQRLGQVAARSPSWGDRWGKVIRRKWRTFVALPHTQPVVALAVLAILVISILLVVLGAELRYGVLAALAPMPTAVPAGPTSTATLRPTFTATPTATDTPTVTPTPTATPTPTNTPTPTDTPTPVPTATATRRPPTATPSPIPSPTLGPPTPTPTPPVEYRLVSVRRLAPCENKGGHSIFIKVLDPAGDPVDGVVLAFAEAGNHNRILSTTVSGTKGPGRAEFDMYKGGYEVYVVGQGTVESVSYDPGRSEVTSLLKSGFVDEEMCPEGGGGNTLFHNSFEVVFERQW